MSLRYVIAADEICTCEVCVKVAVWCCPVFGRPWKMKSLWMSFTNSPPLTNGSCIRCAASWTWRRSWRKRTGKENQQPCPRIQQFSRGSSSWEDPPHRFPGKPVVSPAHRCSQGWEVNFSARREQCCLKTQFTTSPRQRKFLRTLFWWKSFFRCLGIFAVLGNYRSSGLFGKSLLYLWG